MSLKQAPFPIAKNVVLPTENGSYKFIVAGVLPFPGLWKQPHLLFKATHDGMHKAIEDGIRKELSLQNESQNLYEKMRFGNNMNYIQYDELRQ